jgi:hypothetical protein
VRTTRFWNIHQYLITIKNLESQIISKYLATNNRQRHPQWLSRMDNPEKLATLGTQDEDKQNKNKHNTLYVGHHY